MSFQVGKRRHKKYQVSGLHHIIFCAPMKATTQQNSARTHAPTHRVRERERERVFFQPEEMNVIRELLLARSLPSLSPLILFSLSQYHPTSSSIHFRYQLPPFPVIFSRFLLISHLAYISFRFLRRLEARIYGIIFILYINLVSRIDTRHETDRAFSWVRATRGILFCTPCANTKFHFCSASVLQNVNSRILTHGGCNE